MKERTGHDLVIEFFFRGDTFWTFDRRRLLLAESWTVLTRSDLLEITVIGPVAVAVL